MAGPGIFLHAEGFEGWAEGVVEAGTNHLLGANLREQDVVNLVRVSTAATVEGIISEQLRHVIQPFPTTSEVCTSLSEALWD